MEGLLTHDGLKQLLNLGLPGIIILVQFGAIWRIFKLFAELVEKRNATQEQRIAEIREVTTEAVKAMNSMTIAVNGLTDLIKDRMGRGT